MFGRDELLAQAGRRYLDFLRTVIDGSSFFPLELRVGKNRRANTYAERLSELAEFRATAAELNITVEWRMVADPRFGPHERPDRAYFADEEAFLRALDKAAEVGYFRTDVDLIRARCPALGAWLPANVQAVVASHAVWPQLLDVAQWFREHPRSGLYLRQIPVQGVDTKFFERQRAILDALLLFLQPETVEQTQQRFEASHGLRWEEPLVRLRFLDEKMRLEYGFPVTDLALPAPAFRQLGFTRATAVITENLRNFLALPPVPSGIAILGSGDAASLLAGAQWLRESRILYWGDVDVRGYAILSRLRMEYGQTKSILMGLATIEEHRRWAVTLQQAPQEFDALTLEENLGLKSVCAEGIRLEQERIPYTSVLHALSAGLAD